MSPDPMLTELADQLTARNLMLVTVESCTGGGVAARVTSVAGSSRWFDRGWVTYSNQAKQDMVNVPDRLLARFGAVSEPVAKAMAEGAIGRSGAGRIAVSLTGVAGPDGGSAEKPVGTVFIAWAGPDSTEVRRFEFHGDRNEVQRQSVDAALDGLLRFITRIDI